MPLTAQEAQTVRTILDGEFRDIVQNELDPLEAGEQVFNSLLDVAYNTDNYSVRASLFMLYRLYEPTWTIPFEQFEILMQRYADEKPELSPWEWCGVSKEEFDLL